MNKLLMRILVLVTPFFVSVAWAACEAELNEALKYTDISYQENVRQSHKKLLQSSVNLSVKERNRLIRELEGLIAKAKVEHSGGTRNFLTSSFGIDLCILRATGNTGQIAATSNRGQTSTGQRKTNDPAGEAHQCIENDQSGSGNFGAFKNTCGYKVNFSTCNYRPRTTQGGFNWAADFDCEKQKFGLHTPGAGASVAAHNRNTELVYWFACKAPASPTEVEFVAGSGVRGRCN